MPSQSTYSLLDYCNEKPYQLTVTFPDGKKKFGSRAETQGEALGLKAMYEEMYPGVTVKIEIDQP